MRIRYSGRPTKTTHWDTSSRPGKFAWVKLRASPEVKLALGRDAGAGDASTASAAAMVDELPEWRQALTES